jgi:hypothetical protein
MHNYLELIYHLVCDSKKLKFMCSLVHLIGYITIFAL